MGRRILMPETYGVIRFMVRDDPTRFIWRLYHRELLIWNPGASYGTDGSARRAMRREAKRLGLSLHKIYNDFVITRTGD